MKKITFQVTGVSYKILLKISHSSLRLWMQYAPLKGRYTSTRLYGFVTQKAVVV
jgi:hypothetical protein